MELREFHCLRWAFAYWTFLQFRFSFKKKWINIIKNFTYKSLEKFYSILKIYNNIKFSGVIFFFHITIFAKRNANFKEYDKII